MEKQRYIYLDDEQDNSTQAIADGLRDTQGIDVQVDVPQKDFGELKKSLIDTRGQYDGIILDLRLDGDSSNRVPYNAPSIAQELRMLASEGEFVSCPIILCSTDDKMKRGYDLDKTSHDLFDYKFHKGSGTDWEKHAKKLRALAKGYIEIKDRKPDLKKIIAREDIEDLDSRIFEKLQGNEKAPVIYDYAWFLVKKLFHKPGPLIKETLLAARLGIDIDKSSDWKELLNILEQAKYQGVFHEGWDRWWFDKIQSNFKEKTGGRRLASLNAVERVDAIKEFTNLQGLVAAEPISMAKSTYYWTRCEFHKKPLDPLEGFKTASSIDLSPWQEPEYYSLDAILNQPHVCKPHFSEKERIDSYKQTLHDK